MCVTCVRLPVFVSHAEAVNIEFHKEISAEEARRALEEFEGVVVLDDPSRNIYSTPIEAATQDPVLFLESEKIILLRMD